MLDGIYEKALQRYLQDEMRILNAHLPRKQKSLADLLCEEYPHVVCSDNSVHLIKRKELRFLAEVITPGEQSELFLPILIELHSDNDETTIISPNNVTEKIISAILEMPLTHRQGRVILYKPQIALLRNKLKTTIQYVFSPGISVSSKVSLSNFTESSFS